MSKMSLHLLVFSLVPFLYIVTFGQQLKRAPNGQLVGDVAGEAENAPISKVFVLVHSDVQDQKDVIIKVSDGRFQLSLAPGLYDIFVAASGFAHSCKKIKIFASQIAIFQPRLGLDNEHPQQSRVK